MSGEFEISDLKKHIGFWMRVVSNQVSHAFAKKLADSGVTVAEWVILREMYGSQHVISPNQVATLTGLTRGAVSKLIERLLSKGLVTRKESKEDRRYQVIALTREAKGLLPKLAKIADENDAYFFSPLTLEEKRILSKLLIKLARENNFSQLPIS